MALNNGQLLFFAKYIEKELGIVYAEENYFQLEQRLGRIATAVGLGDSQALYEKAQSGVAGDLKTLLLDVATNNETSFFRDPKVFKVIEESVLPSLKAKFPGTFSFRAWSAASSSGQEIYSLAMLAEEFLAKNPGHPRLELVATDISDTILKKAKSGKYSHLEVQRGLSAGRLVKYFEKSGESDWELKQEIKRQVRFSKFNLLDSTAAMGKFHLILCRYVLIYQDTERKKQILNRLVDCLVPGGVIFLGASESALGLTDRLAQVAKDGAIFYERK